MDVGKLGSYMAEFEIPLLSESSHQAIETSFSRSDIIELADDCRRDFENDGPEAVLKQYSLFHSVIRRFDELDTSVRGRYWVMTLQALEGLCQHLGSLEIATLCANEKKQQRNATKMLCYIAVRMVELYERDTSPLKQQMTGRKKKPHPPGDEPRVVGGVPADGKQQIVCLLSQLSELEIVCLWDPPSTQMMENLSGLIAQLCYKLLENSSISKDQSLRDRVIHLLGILVRDYGQALSVALKVIQLLQHFDHLVSLLANAVATFTTQFNCKNVAVEVVRELGGKDPRDLSVDSSGTRSFASFLVELCHLVPGCVLLSVSVLLPHLNGDSYTFRNGVLGVIAELLLHLHKSPLDDQSRQLRDSLFTKLEDHIHDTNAFVRVKVLQLLLQLIIAQAVPLPRTHTEVSLVAGRLRDKSSSVRKNALQLLVAWLTHNPFSGKLSRTEFEEKLLMEQNHLRQLVGNGEREERDGKEEESGQTLKQAAVVQYYTDALQFINTLQECVPIATQLLGSKVASDVLEALEFLSIAEQFSLSGGTEGLRKAMVLIWSRDENIRKALINTYVKIYFTFEPKTTRIQQTTQIIDNLLLLTQHSTVGELASLHRLVGELVEAGHIPLLALKALIELCVGCHGDRSRVGMQLLVMVSSAQPTIIRSNLDAFVSTGFTQNQTNPDLLLAKYVCQVIQNLAVSESKAKSGKGKSKPLQSAERLPSTHLMFSQLLSLLVSQLTVTSNPHWCPLAEQAIGLAYKLSSQPDKFAEQLLKEIVRKTFTNDSNEGDINSLVLSRLLFCAGQIAFLQMVHCEVVVAMELKNRRATDDTTNISGKTSSAARKSVGGDDGLELTGASADDTEAELIKKILETEVGGAGGLLATFEPLILGVVTNPSKYSCPTLQTSACLALAKYMMISSSLCEKYVQLFFTVLEKSSLECVRANTVIAASDLACRFPNLLEPWIPYIYSRLRDPSPLVRRNALTILTYLILNDMVKVRGQISSMAMCLEDSNPRIADLAKLFFHELAQKGNTLYNVLPDIISHLSDPSITNAANQNSFQNIVKFLFGFIQKDRLCESLVEKLCHRFRAARSVEQDHDLAYCLTLLPVTERTLRKLQENLSCYQDKLVDPQVYAAFTTIINKLKKLSKPELKTAVEEFELRLREIHTKGLGEEGRREKEEEGREGEQEQKEATSKQGQVEDQVIKSSSPQPPDSDKNEDFSSDVLTSARKRLISATPTTPLSLSAQGKRNVTREGVSGSRNQGTKHHTGRRKRRVVDSSDSETENQSPRARLQLDCSSDSDFTH